MAQPKHIDTNFHLRYVCRPVLYTNMWQQENSSLSTTESSAHPCRLARLMIGLGGPAGRLCVRLDGRSWEQVEALARTAERLDSLATEP